MESIQKISQSDNKLQDEKPSEYKDIVVPEPATILRGILKEKSQFLLSDELDAKEKESICDLPGADLHSRCVYNVIPKLFLLLYLFYIIFGNRKI